jgi:hypothetical protein
MWYQRVVKDLANLQPALDYYSIELIEAAKETKLSGSLERNAQELSGSMAYRYDQLQEIEAILKYLNIQYDRLRSAQYKKYNEKYNRDLTDRAINNYIDGEQDIIDMAILVNDVALVRNRYLAITKGFEAKGFMIGHITRLRQAGLEDSALK